ncbi:KRI1-like family C-terminal-domain-containing protein [Syncephalis plumigaleata]|nr:KRI1-like family C-terminal-domain-containing protein [Syncephalis plumigaleata]
MSSSDEETFNIRVNETYAKKYEEKKRKEELGQLREKYGDIEGIDDEKLSRMAERAQDETGELLTPAMDAQIMRTLLALRNKDPSVYDENTKFYSEELVEEAQQKWKETQIKKKNSKPVTLQDFQRKCFLKRDELKSAVKQAFGDDDDDDDNDDEELFTQRNANNDGEVNYKSFLLEAIKSGDSNKHTDKLMNSLNTDGNNNNEDAFLLNYVLNRGWLDGNVGKQVEPIVDDVDLVEDEQAVEAADHFESEYNFRFEEEGSTQLVHHSRNVEDTLRRKDNTRKLERERRKERKEEEKLKKMEELKRLKNLKKMEIMDKLRKIQEITGNTNVGVDDINLEEDFNPDSYDATMGHLFDNTYYEESDKRKPVFEDDIDISDIIGNEADNADEDGGDKKKDKKKKKKKKKKKGGEGDEDGDNVDSSALDYEIHMDADYLPDGEKFTQSEEAVNNEKTSKKRKKLDDYLDEYYKLDYEDIVAGIPTRFKYRQVKPSTYGLSPVDILLADDTDLNAHVSVKKLAPYRAPEVQQKDERKYSKKKRVQEFLYGVTGDDNNGADTIDGDYIGEQFIINVENKLDCIDIDIGNRGIRRDGVGYAPTGELGVPSQPMLNIKAWMKATPALSAELEALTRLHNDARMHKWIKRAGEQSVLKKLHTYEVENGVCIVYPFITGKSILDHFDALQYLHELGIIHRDIWHKNIMITPATKGNPVKLTIIDYDRSEFLDTNAFLPLDTWRRLLNNRRRCQSAIVTIFTTMLRVQFDDNSVAAIKDYVNKAGHRLQQMKIHGYENWRSPFNSPITNGDNYNHYPSIFLIPLIWILLDHSCPSSQCCFHA